MPTIINIHGPMASGKSTLTDLLFQSLKTYSYVDRPSIKRALRRAGRTLSKTISKKASMLIIKELMQLRKNIITQEFASADLRKKLHPLITKYGYRFTSFYVQCSLKTAIQRDIQRSKKTRTQEVIKVHRRAKGPSFYDVFLDTDRLTPQQCVAIIKKELRKHNHKRNHA